MKERKTEDKEVGPCIMCGKKFIIRVRKNDNKILTKCFHSHMRKHLWMNWHYKLPEKLDDMANAEVVFKNTFWKIVAYTKLQRWIIYETWELFYGRQKIEYWECPKCCKK